MTITFIIAVIIIAVSSSSTTTAAADLDCMVLRSSDILITKTDTKPRMIDFSFTETKTNTENILKTETIYKSKF